MTDDPPAPADATDEAAPRPAGPHYGGQAVIEGVMMRGPDRWAVAVRRPGGDLWLECHPVAAAGRPTWQRVPLLRGSAALADSLRTGMRALGIAAEQAAGGPDPEPGDASTSTGTSALVAALLFLGVFVVVPVAVTAGLDVVTGGSLGAGAGFHLLESVLRIGLFLAYLAAISRVPDVQRLFRYHGAEHQTIAAFEDGQGLEPATVAGYATRHVRCGTNFLAMAMLLAVVVFTAVGVLVPRPAGIGVIGVIASQVALRLLLLPVVAGLAYEGLRLGATAGDHLLVRAAMRPGLLLQRITTAQPSADQIEVAIRAFEAVAPRLDLAGRAPRTLTSPVTLAPRGLAVELAHATIRAGDEPAPTDGA